MRFFRDMRIGARLGLGFSILILLSVMAAGIGIERLNTVRSIADRLGTEDAETVVLTQQWVQAIDSNAARTWVVFFAKDPAIVARVKADMKTVVTAHAARKWRDMRNTLESDPGATSSL